MVAMNDYLMIRPADVRKANYATARAKQNYFGEGTKALETHYEMLGMLTVVYQKLIETADAADESRFSACLQEITAVAEYALASIYAAERELKETRP